MMLVLKLATFFGETIEVTVGMCKQRSVHRINNTTVVFSRSKGRLEVEKSRPIIVEGSYLGY